MKSAGYILTAMASLAWGADEVSSYAEGLDRVGADGWVLLCHSADWDSTHDEQWMRRQNSILSSCGNALILYVPVYQNPSAEQADAIKRLLQGADLDLSKLKSVPCAILLDQDGRPYASVSGENFTEQATSHIRQAQTKLRTRNNILRQAAEETGPQKAQTLNRLWRLNITPPPGLKQDMQAADPEDQSGLAEWSPFDPWALVERIYAMPWQEAIAELDRIQQAPLSQEERQALLAIRIGCVHYHLGAAGVKEITNLANACTALAPGTPLGKAAQRALRLWSSKMDLGSGWNKDLLPRMAAECEITGTRELNLRGEYRVGIVPTGGQDPVRVTRVALYDGDTKVSEDIHTCCLKAGEELTDNEYMLIVHLPPSRPRLLITFDQQGKTDCKGGFTLRYFNENGTEVYTIDKTKEAADKAREEVSKRDFKANESGKTSEATVEAATRAAEETQADSGEKAADNEAQ